MYIYEDRDHAGKVLLQAIKEEPSTRNLVNPLILAIPRGGVVVAHQVASGLCADLDLIMTKKIGAPWNPEFALAAVDLDGHITWPRHMDENPWREFVEKQARTVAESISRRLHVLRGQKPVPSVHGRTVVVVDDGLATGLTARAAGEYLKRHGVSRLILAVPVGAPETIEELRSTFPDIISPLKPDFFYAVGEWYRDFSEVTDEDVQAILREHQKKTEPGASS